MSFVTFDECPWCGGKDKNFRPIRFGSVPCAHNWHSRDAQEGNRPCKKHGHMLPCYECKIEALEGELATIKRAVLEYLARPSLDGKQPLRAQMRRSLAVLCRQNES